MGLKWSQLEGYTTFIISHSIIFLESYCQVNASHDPFTVNVIAIAGSGCGFGFENETVRAVEVQDVILTHFPFNTFQK